MLILAFDCHPTLPSLPVIAYKMCRELGEIADVTVVTRKQDDYFGVPGARTEFVDIDFVKRPLDRVANLLRGGNSVGWTTKTAFTYPTYLTFEREVWKRYKEELHGGMFDAVLRISPMSPILVSPLAKWSPVPFIIGPVNGGLAFPKEMSFAQKEEREWLNPLRRFHKLLPYARSSYRHAAAILAGFEHTFNGLPKDALKNAINFPEVGFDPNLFYPSDVLPQTDRLQFVFVGRLVPGKAPATLVEAFAENPVLRRHRLTIVGEGPERKVMERMIAANALQDSVELVGAKGQAEVGDLLRSAHVFAFPSVRELGAGVVIEAMASGLPCVVFKAGAQGCLVDESRGIPIPLVSRENMASALGNAMQRYADDLDLLAEHRACALKYAKGFTWKCKARNILKTIRWVLGEIKEKPEFYPL